MNCKILCYILVLFLFSGSCVSEFILELPNTDKEILIIEGNIIENKEVKFYLSKSFSLNESEIPVHSKNVQAKLVIVGNNGYKSNPAIYLGDGVYQMAIGELDFDVAYGIQIEYDGNIYVSTPSKPLYTPDIDSISWVQPVPEGDISFRISTHKDNTTPIYVKWNYEEDWETMAHYRTIFFYDPQTDRFYNDESAPYYHCWKNNKQNKILIGTTESLTQNKIINKQLYQHDASDERFSILYSVKITQLAISKTAYDYYQNKLKLNEEMGGIFTPQPSDIYGNITCQTNPAKKVIGYVGVTKNITEKRIFLDTYEISRPIIYSTCNVITPDSVENFMNQYRLTVKDYYNLGYRPLTEGMLPETSESWANGYCTDCTLKGGSKNKPDFWPNDHK